MASKKIERGLVVGGVDGSAHSVAALDWAARYAAAQARRSCRLRLALPDRGRPATGRDAGTGPAPDRGPGASPSDDAVAQVYPPQARAEVDAQIAYGHPSEVLIDMSKEADLLVVGGSGHSAFTGMLLGSVSIHCVTSAFCPVTVIRGSEAGAGAG